MRAPSIAVLLLAASCARAREPRPPITVFAAASLARPLAVLADSFKRRTDVAVLTELGGSMEQSRKITELNRVPDVLMLVDDDVITALAPAHLEWYARFATNRLVVAYTAKSKHADAITAANWWMILSRTGIAIGRADPDIAPAGKYALRVLRRAEDYYKQPRLADSLFARAALRFVRPNATEIAALLETAEVDYIIDYESVARQYGFKFVELPEDLAPPVLYGISIPRRAAHRDDAVRFVEFTLSEAGKKILRDANVNVLPLPVAIGTNVPSAISSLVRTATDPAAVR